MLSKEALEVAFFFFLFYTNSKHNYHGYFSSLFYFHEMEISNTAPSCA